MLLILFLSPTNIILIMLWNINCIGLQGLPKLDVRIKWPNDLYLNGLKVGGILCTSTYRSKKFNVCVGKCSLS